MPSSTPRLPTSPLASLALILVAVAGRWWLGPAEPTVARPRNSTEQEPAMPVALAGNNARSASIGSRAVILAGLAVVVAALAGGGRWFVQSQRLTQEAAVATGGDPDRALPIMLANGCAGCHMIPGVPGAQGLVGPRLDGSLAQRVYIGGSLPNTAPNLIRWLRKSREVSPRTAMPSTHISEQDARDVAAYLYALH